MPVDESETIRSETPRRKKKRRGPTSSEGGLKDWPTGHAKTKRRPKGAASSGLTAKDIIEDRQAKEPFARDLRKYGFAQASALAKQRLASTERVAYPRMSLSKYEPLPEGYDPGDDARLQRLLQYAPEEDIRQALSERSNLGSFFSKLPSDLGMRFAAGASVFASQLLPSTAALGSAALHDVFVAPATGDENQLWEDIAKPTAQAYKQRYVDPLTEEGIVAGLNKIRKEAGKDPFTYGLDAAASLAITARGATAAQSARRGEPIFRGQYHPVEPRTVRIGSLDVPLSQSRHPLTRWAESVFDDFSRLVGDVPVIGKPATGVSALAIGPEARGARAIGKGIRQESRRLRAEGAAPSRRIRHISLIGPTNDALRTRLYWESQVPEHLRGDVLEAAKQDLIALKAAPIEVPVLAPTPKLERQRARVSQLQERFNRQVAKREEKLGIEGEADRIPVANLGTAHVTHLGAQLSGEKEKLARLERLHVHRETKRTIAGLEKQKASLQARAAKAADEEEFETLTDRVAKVEQQIAERKQVLEMASRRRTHQLNQRISEIEKAQKTTPGRKYEEAMDAAVWFTQGREKILTEAFGPEIAAMFAERRGLVGERLFDDETPSDVFVSHTSEPVSARSRIGRGLGLGRTDTAGLKLNARNELGLYKSGRLNTSPDAIVDSWLRAQAFAFANSVKAILMKAGQPIAAGTAPKPGWFVVNPKGRAKPHFWRDIEAGDDAALVSGLEDYYQSFLQKGDELPDGIVDMEGMVQVDPKVMNMIFGRYGTPGKLHDHAAGTAVDVINGLVKTSLLYLNPGYIPANFLGNLIFLGIQTPAMAIPSMFRAGKILTRDRELADLVEAEVGFGPTIAIASDTGSRRQGEFSQGLLQVEQGIARKVGGLSDNWPRAAAWVWEARRSGFKTREQMMALLKDPKHEHDRELIRSRANEAMVNFDRLRPDERATAARVFFVWPWIRGATAWAARFVLDNPEKAAILNEIGKQLPTSEETLGNLPPYLENAIPIGEPEDGEASIYRTGAISPTSTALEVGETAVAVSKSLFAGDLPEEQRDIYDFLTPIIGVAIQTLKSENQYGQEMSRGEAIAEALRGLLPQERLIQELVNPEEISELYTDKSRPATLRRALRVFPVDIDLKVANERADRTEGKEEKETPLTRERDWLKKMEKEYGELPAAVLRARRAKFLYEEGQAAMKKALDVNSLTDKQRSAVALGVLLEQGDAWDDYADELRSRLRETKQGTTAFLEYNRWLREKLGWTLLDQFDRDFTERKRQKADDRAGSR